MENWQFACLIAYCGIVVLLGLYGFHRYQLLRLFRKHRDVPDLPLSSFTSLPRVTVQLPLYNEFHVVERLLQAVGRIDYPRDLLQIQVLDDSQDETSDRARRIACKLEVEGLDIEYIHRRDRTGFKAGALAAGLERASGEFILILDADFVPQPQILHQAIHYFTDPRIGMVQMRWGHINRHYSLLTRIQSIFLDGHFVIEHTARNRSGRFFNFNGTAGIWRRQAITDAGGWQHDTLTEDLDLSYRAQLAGWKFHFLPEIAVPGEIPVEMDGFKAQQHRWTKGAVQTAKKLLPRVWRSGQPLAVKVEATFHLTANICYILMLLMALLTLPVLTVRSQLGWERLLIVDLPLFSFATVAVSGFYMASQKALYPDWKRQIKYLPLLMSIGMGMCINNTRAVLEGLIGHQSAFLRTPKYGLSNADRPRRRKYASPRTLLTLGELGMALYFLFVLYYAWSIELYLGLPFLLLFYIGFLYTGLMSGLQPWLYQFGLRLPQWRFAS
ncbi:MAG: glycosyltransferase [Gemmatimonadetes bacterium]|jgi:cellulose synthase/poly-beta-1,6-N-acetylglucosamine synthase-like glycosyltransferase|nr:glycosyltransferase [Gemmatimonadota bacterium]